MKPVPILGTIVLIGVVCQILLGLQITGAGADYLIGPHILIGVLGLILVIVLAVTAFRAKGAKVYSKLVITILTIVVIIQVGLGFELLQGAESMIVSHEINAFLILLLTVAMGAVTMLSARKSN